jgi:hypothetical protein
MLLACSCSLWESERDEKIHVINLTGEDVVIYYHDFWGLESRLTTIDRDETRFIYVSPGITYYARGESSKKEYGKGKFAKVPTRYDIQQTWTIQ